MQTKETLLLDAQEYLMDNFIDFDIEDETVFAINGERYSLSLPTTDTNEKGEVVEYLFDSNFGFIGRTISESDFDHYIYRFGGVWYTLKKGSESNVKLKPVKYIGTDASLPSHTGNQSFLGVHGQYEILNGVGNYSTWIEKAKFMGLYDIGICEKNTLAGVLKFQIECVKKGLHPILGEEISVIRIEDEKHYTLKLFAKNKEGWASLLFINAILNTDQIEIKESDLEPYLDDNLLIIIDPKTCNYSQVRNACKRMGIKYYQLDTVCFEKEKRDNEYLANLKLFVNDNAFSPIAMSDAYYPDRDYYYMKKTLNRVSGVIRDSSENQHFKNWFTYYNELKEIAGNRTQSLFDEATKNLENECFECDFQVETSVRNLPEYPMTEEEKKVAGSNIDLFWYLIGKGLEKHSYLFEKYGEDVITDRIQTEIEIMERGGVIDYFLTLHDICNWCKSNKIFKGAGRGSAAGSLIVFLLGITEVDPLEFGLLFSRFLTSGRLIRHIDEEVLIIKFESGIEKEMIPGKRYRLSNRAFVFGRDIKGGDTFEGGTVETITPLTKSKVIPGSLPDIDTDTQGERRADIKRYMRERFGEDQVCSVGTYTTLQVKAGIKDFGKLEGVSFFETNMINAILKNDAINSEDFFKVAANEPKVKSFINKYSPMVNDILLSIDQPKARSVHACAMMIFPSDKTMYEYCPVRLDPKSGETVSEWEGIELDEAGFLKEDMLSVAQMDKFNAILNLIEKKYREKINLFTINKEDKSVYEFFGHGWNSDVFQMGAPGLSSYCKTMKPDCFADIIACTALYRPGAIENNFHNEYILRKHGDREVSYPVGAEHILKETYGLPIYQEHIMLCCQELAGFDSETADSIRKALGKKDMEKILKYGSKFTTGYVENFGVTEKVAKDLWTQFIEFAKYSFNKSHAAAYSFSSYASQWLKVYYPTEFWSVALSYAKSKDVPSFIAEMFLTGSLKLSAVDINLSEESIVGVDNTLYWPIQSVTQVGEGATEALLKERSEFGEFFSLSEFLNRCVKKGSRVTKSTIENLIYSGAFDRLEKVSIPSDRMKLLKYYWKEKSVKVNTEIDRFTRAGEKVKYNWWWILQQKKLSGLAFFDYSMLCLKYLLPRIGKGYVFKDGDHFKAGEVQSYAQKAMVGGYVISVDIKSGKRGTFANLVLEQNYKMINVTVFNDMYEANEDIIKEAEGNILLINGTLQFSKFKDSNILQANDDSAFILLT